MEGWRERGFVPDSDDDGSQEEQPILDPLVEDRQAPSRPPHNLRLPEELDAELSDTSSLLSSVESFIEDLPHSSPAVIHTAQPFQGDLKSAEATPFRAFVTDRLFRARRPDQLQPYQYDERRFRAAMVASGVKPFRSAVDVQAKVDRRSARDKETQDQEFLLEESQSQSQSQAVPNSSQTASSPSSSAPSEVQYRHTKDGYNLAGPSLALRMDAEECDLPDVLDVIRSDKRKETVGYSRRLRDSRPIKARQRAIRQDQSRGRNGGGLYPVIPILSAQNSIPTPGHRADVSSNFRMPFGYVPTATTTSSPAKGSRRHLRVIHDDDSSSSADPDIDTIPEGRTPRMDPTMSIPRQSDHDSQTERPAEQHKLKKKIKGVLPASWLSLDQLAQKQQENDLAKKVQRKTDSRRKDLPQRGVAKRVFRSQQPSNLSPFPTNDDGATTSTDESEPKAATAVLPLPADPQDDRPVHNLETGAMWIDDYDDENFVAPFSPLIPLVAESRDRQSSSPFSPRNNSNRLRPSLQKLYDRNDSSPARGETRPAPLRTVRAPSQYIDLQDFDDIVEVNWIDPMTRAPPRRKARVRRAKRRKLHATGTDDLARFSVANQHRSPIRPQTRRFPRPVVKRRPTLPSAGKTTAHVADKRLLQRSTTLSNIVSMNLAADRHSREQQTEIFGDSDAHVARPQTRSDLGQPDQTLHRHQPIQQLRAREVRHPFMRQEKLGWPTSSGDRLPLQDRSNVPPQRRSSTTAQTGTKLSELPKAERKNQKSIREQKSYGSSVIQSRPAYRAAQLESLEDAFDDRSHRVDLRKLLRQHKGKRINQRVSRRDPHIPGQGLIPEIDDAESLPNSPNWDVATNHNSHRGLEQQTPLLPGHKGGSEQTASKPSTLQPSPADPYISANLLSFSITPREAAETNRSLGLASNGATHPITFGITPLEPGTYYHRSTFIGDETLHSALELKADDLDSYRGQMIFTAGGEHLIWSRWTEELAANLSNLFREMSRNLKSVQTHAPPTGCASEREDCLDTMTKVSNYFSNVMSFQDTADRIAYATSFTTTCKESCDLLNEALIPQLCSNDGASGRTLRAAILALLLTFQAYTITRHQIVPAQVRNEAKQLCTEHCRRFIHTLLQFGMPQLRAFLEYNKNSKNREQGIQDGWPFLDGLLTVKHVLQRVDDSSGRLWELITADTLEQIANLSSLFQFERVWRDVFTLLPLLEIDDKGILSTGSRFSAHDDGCTMVKALLSRLFDLYLGSQTRPAGTTDHYFRASLARCHHLIQYWGWSKCEPILQSIFDFFARRNGLLGLKSERQSGSPAFLEMSNPHMNLSIQSGDQSFAIFLKTLATGLQAMSHHNAEKTMRNIIYRFIPLHNRTFRREDSLKEEDLEALQNHHDLLCTLYFASPPNCRPKVKVIQSLVDHKASHRRTSRLAVLSWIKLVNFQLSAEEPVSSITPFSTWSGDMLEQNVQQYWYAQTEAETQFAQAEPQDAAIRLTEGLLQSTIHHNQRPVLATLVELLAGLRSAIASSAGNLETSLALLQSFPFQNILGIFDARKESINDVIQMTLEILSTFTCAVRTQVAAPASDKTRGSDESQEYGSSDIFDDFLPVHPLLSPPPSSDAVDETEDETDLDKTTTFILSVIYDPMARLVSNAFGGDISPKDDFLEKILETWTLINACLAQAGKKPWDCLFEEYSTASWSQLPNTIQKQRFWPNLMAGVLRHDVSGATYRAHQPKFLSTWINALTTPDFKLSFQHKLTAALVQVDPGHPLLKDLLVSGRAMSEVSLSEFKARRLDMIATFFMNMRYQLSKAAPSIKSSLRLEYSDLIATFSQSIKQNYQQCKGQPAEKVVYETFVHSVVELLQQYTTEIRAIDKYFTDNVAFPLPISDPTYLVGRLKSYSGKLCDLNQAKAFTTFFQGMSQRAAAENQQLDFAKQVTDAIASEVIDAKNPAGSIMQFFIHVIFPVYLDDVDGKASGYIMATPVLLIMQSILSHYIYRINGLDGDSTRLALSSVVHAVDAIGHFFVSVSSARHLFLQSHTLHLLASALRVLDASLGLLEYLYSLSGRPSAVFNLMCWVDKFSGAVADSLLEDHNAGNSPSDLIAAREKISFPALRESSAETTHTAQQARNFAATEYRNMDQHWSVKENIHVHNPTLRLGVRPHALEWTVQRAGVFQRIQVPWGRLEDEIDGVARAVLTVRASMERFSFGKVGKEARRLKLFQSVELQSIRL